MFWMLEFHDMPQGVVVYTLGCVLPTVRKELLVGQMRDCSFDMEVWLHATTSCVEIPMY